MTSDEIRSALLNCDYIYAADDIDSVVEMQKRISRTGRLAGASGNFISYSNLVEGIGFNLPSINNGNTHIIDTSEWTGQDRRICGDFAEFS